MTWVAVFLAMVVTDVVWTKWSQAITAKKPIASGIYSALIVSGSAFTIVQYTSDPWLILPAALGAFVGTYYTVSPWLLELYWRRRGNGE